MQIYLTELEDRVLHHHDTERLRRHHPTLPRVRTRTRVAASLRRVADRLES
jgi:hypothetical protein